MIYCPYTPIENISIFGEVVLVNNADVLITSSDEKYTFHFLNQNEAKKFMKDFKMSCLAYSMETEADLKAKTDDNVGKLKSTHNLQHVHKEDIMLSRRINISGNNINFLIGENQLQLLDSEKALQFILQNILKDNQINLSQRLWGKQETAKIAFLLFSDRIPNISAEQLKSIQFYIDGKCTRINRFMQSKIWNADFWYHDLETRYSDVTLKEMVDIIFDIVDAMQPIDKDIVVYRGSSEYDFGAYDFDDKLNEVVFPNFTSTSATAGGAVRFASGIFYKLIIPKGTSLLWAGLLGGDYIGENEILLPPGKFKILDNHRDRVEYYTLEFEKQLTFDQVLLDHLGELKDVAEYKKNIQKVMELDSLITYVQTECAKRSEIIFSNDSVRGKNIK